MATVRPRSRNCFARKGDWCAHRSDHSTDEAARSALDSWSPALKILQPQRPALHAVDAELMLAYKKVKSARSCTRINEAGSTASSRRGQLLRHAQRADDPGSTSLLAVRVHRTATGSGPGRPDGRASCSVQRRAVPP